MVQEKCKPFKTYAPFGVATKRFTKVGFHPSLDKSGAMKREITKVGPSSYYPKSVGCIAKSSAGWAGQLKNEEFSQNLGYRFPKLLEERRFQKSLGGPGTTDLNEDLFKREGKSVLENVGFGTMKRFQRFKAADTCPAPGTYFYDFNKQSTIGRQGFNSMPQFEWDGFIDRFRPKDPSYLLPPNQYDKSGDGKGIDTLLKKHVSLRGPYDLFTGPRDGTTIKNKFSPPMTKVPDTHYIKPTEIEILLNHPSKKKCGQFLRSKRFPKKPTVKNMMNDVSLCYRDPNDPGPNQYDLSGTNSIQLKKPSLHPFDTSTLNARPATDWRIRPGPGRYNPKPPRCMKVKRPSPVFLSKDKRHFFHIIDYRSF